MNLDPIRSTLDREAAEGRTVQFWWRDDDAIAATPELDRLLSLSGRAGLPIAIATIPAGLHPSLPDRLRAEDGARLLIHGLSHRNHAGPGRKAAEFGADRALDVLASEAAAALKLVRTMAGAVALPVFVPPWNRLAPDLPAALPRLGYRGLSTFGPARASHDLAVVNTHLDPVDWRGTRQAVEPELLARAFEAALASAPGQPVGLLTHHAMFDEGLWALTSALADLLAAHPACRWPQLDGLWKPNCVIEL